MPKSKKNIKVRDLKPTKDAKGGGGHPVLGGGKVDGGGKAETGGGKASDGGGKAVFGAGMN